MIRLDKVQKAVLQLFQLATIFPLNYELLLYLFFTPPLFSCCNHGIIRSSHGFSCNPLPLQKPGLFPRKSYFEEKVNLRLRYDGNRNLVAFIIFIP